MLCNAMRLRLTEGVSCRHIVAFYFCTYMTILAYTFVNAAQPSVLRDVVHIPEEEKGRYSGNLNFYAELIIIVLVALWGVLSDKVGRRVVYALGLFLMACGLSAYPFATSYGVLIIFRLLFAVGAASAAAMMTAVLADYVVLEDKGKAAGYMGVMAGMGAVTAAVGFLKIPKLCDKWFEHEQWYTAQWGIAIMFASAAGALVLGTLVCCALAGTGEVQARNSQTHVRDLLRDGFAAAYRDGHLALAYFAGYVARGDAIVLTLWLSQWVNDFETAHGASSSSATARAGMVTGIAQTCALAFAPVSGIMASRMGMLPSLIFVSVLAVIGYAGLASLDNPSSGRGLLFACIIGMGEIGLVVISQALVSQRAPEHIRGAVGGAFGLCGSLGILTCTKLGGYLYDGAGHSGPFLLFAVCSAIVVVGAAAILCVRWAAPPVEEYTAIPTEPNPDSEDPRPPS